MCIKKTFLVQKFEREFSNTFEPKEKPAGRGRIRCDASCLHHHVVQIQRQI